MGKLRLENVRGDSEVLSPSRHGGLRFVDFVGGVLVVVGEVMQ